MRPDGYLLGIGVSLIAFAMFIQPPVALGIGFQEVTESSPGSGVYLWSEPDNWSAGVVPPAGGAGIHEACIGYDEPVICTLDGSGATAVNIIMGWYPGSSGSTLNIGPGATLVSHGTKLGFWPAIYVGHDGEAFLNINGGTVTLTGEIPDLMAGVQYDGAKGTVVMTGGALTIEGGLSVGTLGNWLVDKVGGPGSSFDLQGGLVNIGGTILVGSPDANDPGLLRIAGTASLTGDPRAYLGRSVFEISGGDVIVDLDRLSFGIPNLSHPDETQDPGVLKLSGNGVSTIHAGWVNVLGQTTLDVGELSVPPGSYTAIDGGGLTFAEGGSFVFAPGTDTDLWSFAVDVAAGDLILTYVPEPATGALLALGLMGIMAGGRRY